MMTELVPIGDTILVRPDPIELDPEALGEKIELQSHEDADEAAGESGYKTKGGLIVPATFKHSVERKSLVGTVIAVGGKQEWPSTITVGTRVLYGWHAGWLLENRFPGYKDCIILYERDVLCVLVEVE